DNVDEFVAMPWCTGDPFVELPDEGGTTLDASKIPSGHTWCIVSETTVIHSTTQTRTTWEVVGIGDPKFR
ncbi:MAG TPA: hypothetical protein VJR05_11825, partial [Acidimicrobiia bacterium]|nr:hypothetical protein [Acidimicrobiia bacterium]